MTSMVPLLKKAFWVGFVLIVATLVLVWTMPTKAQAVSLNTDLVSAISVAAENAQSTNTEESAGTLENPYLATITASVEPAELVYLVVALSDETSGCVTYLVQDANPTSLDAINLATTNNDGTCVSDATLDTTPGSYTLWVLAKESASAQSGEVFKISLTLSVKTAEPIFGAYTVTAEEGNTTAIFNVVNQSAYGDDVSVIMYTSEGGLMPSAQGSYENGVLTVTFDQALTGETLTRAKFQAAGEGGSNLSAVMTIYPYGTTAPAAPEFTSPVTANPGDVSATVALTGKPYTGWVLVNVYGEDGYIASGVYPSYDAELNAIVLEFDPMLNKTVTYNIAMVVDDLESPASPLTVMPATLSVERLYNPVNGAHLLTADQNEVEVLTTSIGWIDEGLAFRASSSEGNPVYRLYNPSMGEHLYTTSENERDILHEYYGWNEEGIVWYSYESETQSIPIYRLYNPYPYTPAASHLWTASLNEYNVLAALYGWNQENIGWWALSNVG